MPFADLHCHPAFWSFNQVRNEDSITPDSPDYHIWNIAYSAKALKKKRKGRRATYSQADFASLTAGNVRLAFASLYPVEKGFFMGNRSRNIDADIVGGLLGQLASGAPSGLRKVVAWLLSPVSRVFSLLINNEGVGRDILQKLVMNFSKGRINFFQSSSYSYFRELEMEYEFYKRFDKAKPKEPAPAGTHTYTLVRTATELEAAYSKPDTIAVVLTIEGMHAFTLEQDGDSQDFLTLSDNQIILNRIRILKEEWGVFFITFSHHFSNHLAGHAHSLPKLLLEISDPLPLMNSGLLPLGKHYLRTLLSVTSDHLYDPALGRRILIDVKHFSARSRKEFYEEIILPYNQKNPNAPIPVIASHCGYYGQVDHVSRIDLNYLISKASNESDDDIIKGFYRWNINLCDEDIQVIVESGGLIGLSFDQRIMGEKNVRGKTIEYWVGVLGRHIVAMIVASINTVNHNPERIWKTLCIGTDFDGIIDPLDTFSTAEKYGVLKTELLRFFELLATRHGEYLFLAGNPYTPVKVVDMIAFENAYEFTKKHLK